MKLFFISSLLCASVILSNAQAKLQERFSWKQVEYEWPSAEAEQEAISSGAYIPVNNLPLGLERWNNKLFVTVPRWKAGVAASLNYIDLNTTEKSPKLRPYPSWETAQMVESGLQSNATIISTFRMQVDKCDRLWAVDTGVSDLMGDTKTITPNAIVIYDLKTDQLVRRYTIPQSQTNANTFFANIVIDSESTDCNNAYAYVPDFQGYGLVVYSFADDRSYRVEHNFFHNDPVQGDFNVGGVNFQWTDGLFGLAVGPKQADNSRDIYFHAFASTKEFKVSNRVLQNETHVTSAAAYHDFKIVGDRGVNGQSATEVYDQDTNVIFYSQVNKNAIGCWNIDRPYIEQTQGIVAKDSQKLIFPNELKVDNEGTVWVLSDKMSVYLYGEWDPTVVNYRILSGNNKELIKNTPCQSFGKKSPPKFGHINKSKRRPNFRRPAFPLF